MDFWDNTAPDQTLEGMFESGWDGILHMIFKLGMYAETKWRRLRGFIYLTKVITGSKFKDGIEATAVDQVAA
jgi:putative transposase